MNPIKLYREKGGLTQVESAFIFEMSRTAVVNGKLTSQNLESIIWSSLQKFCAVRWMNC